MEYAKIDEKIPYNIGQKVKVKNRISEEEYIGNITRIDTFYPNTYNLHVKIILRYDINNKPIYSEAIIYPQPSYSFSVDYTLVEVLNEN